MIGSIPSKIAELVGLATGMTGFRDPPPPNVEESELPLVYVLTGPATNDEEDANYVRETRVYRVRVLIIATGLATPETREIRCRAPLDNVKIQLRKYPTLDKMAWVESSWVAGDSGVIIIPDYDEKFVGFDIEFQVTTVQSREYAPTE